MSEYSHEAQSNTTQSSSLLRRLYELVKYQLWIGATFGAFFVGISVAMGERIDPMAASVTWSLVGALMMLLHQSEHPSDFPSGRRSLVQAVVLGLAIGVTYLALDAFASLIGL